MKILAFDGSGLVASVAIVDDDILLGEYTTNFKKTHSKTLIPMLDEISQMIELDLDTIDAIAVTRGPGSFTGLRISSATVKGLGMALDKPIVSVETTKAMAYNLYGYSGYICPIMDARRNQVYTGIYYFENGEFKTKLEQDAMSIEDLICEVNKLDREVIFLGDGVPVFEQFIGENVRIDFSFAPAHQSRQRAASLAVLAAEYMKCGKVETAAEHRPDYLRLSQAERERIASGKSIEPE